MVSKPSVIGIDVGSVDSIVAFIDKGAVDIVQNELSQRKTPTLVSFTDKQRLLGDAALSTIKSNLKNSCRYMKQVIGRTADSAEVIHEAKFALADLGASDDGFTGYKVTYKGQERTFSATQCFAMYLTKLVEVTEAWTKQKVAHAVISVPSYFTDVHRQALLDACKIQGLECLRLMNEGTATALSYGIYRSRDFSAEEATNIAFCHMGHSAFSTTICKFVQGKVTVLGESVNTNVGGRDMDRALIEYFAEQFKKKTGCDPLRNRKALYKMEEAIGKTKKILSSNAEADIHLECLMEDEDLHAKVTREEYEKRMEPFFPLVTETMQMALNQSGLDKTAIHGVEIVGGAVRSPWVKELIKNFFPVAEGERVLSQTLNADECVARGCALQAAILSPLYKVREFAVEDLSTLPYQVSWTSDNAVEKPADDEGMDVDDEKKEAGDVSMEDTETAKTTLTVFPSRSCFGERKLMSFTRKGPFEVSCAYGSGSCMEGQQVGRFAVDLPASPEARRVKVSAGLTLHGTFKIDKAYYEKKEEYEVKERVKQVKAPAEGQENSAPPQVNGSEPATNGTANGTESTETPTPAEGDVPAPQADGEVPMEGAEEAKPEAKPEAGDAAEAKTSPAKAPEPEYEWVEVTKTKKRTIRVDVPVRTLAGFGLADALVQQGADAESSFQAESREIRETDDARNEVESYIYDMREKLRNVYSDFVEPQKADNFSEELTKSEDWLYDKWDASKVELVEKLNSLKLTGDPIVLRYREADGRQEAASALMAQIQESRLLAKASSPDYEHIAQEKKDQIVKQCDEAEQWLNTLQSQQNALPKCGDVLLKIADMRAKQDDIKRNCDRIMSEPKPAPPKTEPKAEEKAEAPPAEGAADQPDVDMADAEKPAEEPEAPPSSMDVD